MVMRRSPESIPVSSAAMTASSYSSSLPPSAGSSVAASVAVSMSPGAASSRSAVERSSSMTCLYPRSGYNPGMPEKATKGEFAPLPSTLERSPKKAQDTYEKTLEHAEETYGGDEERAHRAAWAS